MIGAAGRTDTELLHLAEAAGLVPEWQDAHGRERRVEEPVLRGMLNTMELPCDSPRQISESLHRLEREEQSGAMLIVTVNEPLVFRHAGSLVYTLTLEGGKQYIGRASPAGRGRIRIPGIRQAGYHQLAIGDITLTLAVAPKRCPTVDDVIGWRRERAWGVAAQVYSLRRSRPRLHAGKPRTMPGPSAPIVWPGWEAGGDFGLLAELASRAAQSGASAVAISPVHAMFSADPARNSPYAPSSRLFLNTAYIDPSIVLGMDAPRLAASQLDTDGFRAAASDGGHVDWPLILPRRMLLLKRLFENFRRHGPDLLVQKLAAFRRDGGLALESHARYEALHAHYSAVLGPASGWRDWPAELHDYCGPGVEAYAARHETEISFHVFLQWLADGGLRFAQQSARGAGMPIGLIADLAIGTDPRGSHAWSKPGDMLPGVLVGAPPDLFQPQGQNWGLTAFSPRALRQHSYAAFIDTLRAVLAHAGGVRIDHILGLGRMWLIPPSAAPADGVYLRYPMKDMLRLLALEAWRHKAIVIGENLGTVPEGFNETLRRKGILGTSVLWFERSPAAVREPDSESGRELASASETPAPAAATASAFVAPSRWPPYAMATPTTHDLPTITGWWTGRDLDWRKRLDKLADDQIARQADARLRDKTALWRALRDAGCVSGSDLAPPLAAPRDAVLAFVAGTRAPLMIVALEDLLGLSEQPNLPGSVVQGEVGHPNWTQCLPVGVDEIFSDDCVMNGIDAIKLARRKA